MEEELAMVHYEIQMQDQAMEAAAIEAMLSDII